MSVEPEEYCELIAGSAPQRTGMVVGTDEAIGRTAAEDVIADVALPAFATSAMDGYALDVQALTRARAGVRISVTGDVPAGGATVDILPGTAVRVMTGAQVPNAAEAVVPVEFTDASRTGAAPDHLVVTGLPDRLRSGWNIRHVGEDTQVGDTVITAGKTITAAGVGTLAMLGRTEISVQRPLTVGIIVTGDELRTDATASAKAGSGPFIHNSNLPMLASALRQAGAVPLERGCGDDPNDLLQILDDLAGQVDLIITTGGISAGAFEVVRQALEGRHSTFLRLGLRPGGPQGYGRCGNVPMLHSPGTPTGAFLSFHLFAVSLLTGRTLDTRWKKAVFAGPAVAGHRKGVSLAPGRFTAHGEVEIAPRSRLRDFAGADVIIRVPGAPSALEDGDVISVLDC
ncbi:molybdopterin molybdotransferase MoeA [Brevibacterium sp. ZH18]|uniref:molybdopterin molybdotransferase MoeA n=1 Tax=Brevibacterium sp. ZH18 TaxID=2927784 RepID=UPI001F604905|nr:molybdopterin molybdotransferase MoeA [Brevibacterium sp. ZH18]MCI4009983.1 molybdopterin molybdotransferase MoeA [Brevibacterium sp. ZH18]